MDMLIFQAYIEIHLLIGQVSSQGFKFPIHEHGHDAEAALAAFGVWVKDIFSSNNILPFDWAIG
eukprot:7494728-Ditylum_brightwellii.AAC.1